VRLALVAAEVDPNAAAALESGNAHKRARFEELLAKHGTALLSGSMRHSIDFASQLQSSRCPACTIGFFFTIFVLQTRALNRSGAPIEAKADASAGAVGTLAASMLEVTFRTMDPNQV
jgi:hypothetical protein